MRVVVLQHVSFEGPAAIADWVAERGHTLDRVELFAGAPLPEVSPGELLISLGGPMSANDGARYPWLAGELALLQSAHARGVPTLGVCLGAQLIARALGGTVSQAPVKEIGWYMVHASGVDHPLALPERFVPLHWHGETFSLPPGAVLLASTPVVQNQAFAVGRRTLGLQFHVEATPASVAALLEHAAADLDGAPKQQIAEVIELEAPARSRPVNRVLFDLLDRLVAP